MASGSRTTAGSEDQIRHDGYGDDPVVLSGDKPFFDIILSKSHVREPFTLNLPLNVTSKLPADAKRVIVSHGGKTWDMEYVKSGRFRRFCSRDWRPFVGDNGLKVGDACIFEVMQVSGTIVKLKCVFLRHTGLLPPEFLADLGK